MAPLPVLRHGFGGAKLNDVVYYAERLVSAYRPRAVVVFAGTNDIVKWLGTLGMLAGRLEIFTLLVLFLPAYWRN